MELSKSTILRVRISSEDAGAISINPVQRRDVPIVDLVTWIVSVTGKDTPRIEEILGRGSFVLGLSRMRWEPVDAAGRLSAILDSLPGDWPERPLDGDKVREIVISAGLRQISIPGEAARARRWLRGESFLSRWLSSGTLPVPKYERYDYRERADRYRAAIGIEAEQAYREAVDLLRPAALRRSLSAHSPTAVTMLAPR